MQIISKMTLFDICDLLYNNKEMIYYEKAKNKNENNNFNR